MKNVIKFPRPFKREEFVWIEEASTFGEGLCNEDSTISEWISSFFNPAPFPRVGEKRFHDLTKREELHDIILDLAKELQGFTARLLDLAERS